MPITCDPAPRVLSHEWDDTCETCCLSHLDGPHDTGGGCRRCLHCQEWVRPYRRREGCPARLPKMEGVGDATG